MMSKVINLLARNIHHITSNDVVEFCQQNILESVQLDYKQHIPKDLAKHFATFSNTLQRFPQRLTPPYKRAGR